MSGALRLLAVLVLTLTGASAFAQCANPTYEGYGNTTGGAGQSVVTVSNLGNSGAGSLRNAIGDNRCIQFSVWGEIILNTSLDISGANNMTIDGFTAPSPGITLRHCGIYGQGSGTNHIIIRGIRIRMEGSDGACGGTEGDGIQLIEGPHHIIIDHNSVSGALDENIGIAHTVGNGPQDITLSWNIFADPTQDNGNKVNIVIATGAQRVSFHHNLTSTGTRHPRVGYQDDTGAVSPDVMADVRNNLVWQTDEGSIYLSGAKANSINNYFIKSPTMDLSFFAATAIALNNPAQTQLYANGNKANPFLVGIDSAGNIGSPFAVPAVTTTTAEQAACDVTGGAGVFPRDAKDQEVLGRFTLADCGTPICNPANCSNGCCGDSCCAPTPLGNIAKYSFENNANDTGALGLGLHGTLQGNASFSSVAPIVGTHSLLLDGNGDYMTVPITAPWNVGQYVGLAAWVRLMGLDTDGCGVIGTSSYRLGVAANGRPFAAYSDGMVFYTIEGQTSVVDGINHHLAMTVDETHMRLWVDGMIAVSTLRSGPIAVPTGLIYVGRRGGGEDTADCAGRLDAIYVHSDFLDNASVLNLYQEVPSIVTGTSSSHWRFYQADSAEGTTIAGLGVDAPNIVQARSGKVRQRWNVKRNGSPITQFFGTECNVNSIADPLILAWDAVSYTEAVGYKLYRGTAPGVYTTIVDVGAPLTTVVNGLTVGATYYFAVTAYGTVNDLEGPASNEVTYTVPQPNVFTQIDNSCAVFPVCVAADSAKNMGDDTTNLLPTDGFIFVAGRFVVDTINPALQTILADGQETEWETSYAFGASLAHGDLVRCRLRTAAGSFDSYPAILPTITIDVPGVAGGSAQRGGTSRGGVRR